MLQRTIVMANFKDALTPELTGFIQRQPIFFTASATGSGRINLSPKGMDTFRVFDDRTVGYLDFIGSGNETAAHLKHDGRLTIMFCSFDEKPLILRLYGKGEAVQFDSPRGQMLHAAFGSLPGERQIILLTIDSLQTSCGFAVPRMDLVAPRPMLVEWAEKKGLDALSTYRRQKNHTSIDGLPIE
jgi:hypothetical protein